MDKLNEIFELQEKLQERLGINIKSFDLELYKINHLALENELHEALRETPWKPWKKQQTLNNDNLKKELIDALHFFVNLCLLAGMTADDVFNEYTNKNKENHKRQEEDY